MPPVVDSQHMPADKARSKLIQDAVLIARVVAGEQEAKLTLVENLWPRVEGIARHLSPYRSEVEDLTQEAMLQVLAAAPRFQADGCLEAWADTIAVRTILRYLKRMHRAHRVHVPLKKAHLTAVTDGEQAAADRQLAASITALIYRLKPDQRMALVLKLHKGHSLDEVAEIMGRSRWSVRYLLSRGREQMRRMAVKDHTIRELLQENET